MPTHKWTARSFVGKCPWRDDFFHHNGSKGFRMGWVAQLAFLFAAITLPALDGRRVDPLANTRAKAVVLLFTRSDCPISNRYAPEVERLYERFHDRGIDFWLVYVDPSEPEQTIRKHVGEYGYRFGALVDRRHELVAVAKATV